MLHLSGKSTRILRNLIYLRGDVIEVALNRLIGDDVQSMVHLLDQFFVLRLFERKLLLQGTYDLGLTVIFLSLAFRINADSTYKSRVLLRRGGEQTKKLLIGC